MSNLTILNNSIRQSDNLYSLTDLHRASGGEQKHKPVLFLSNQQTKELISEIEIEGKVGIPTSVVKTVRGGKNPSTYACEELMLAYAMWISPKFHLIVLRAFLNLHKKSTALLPNTITPEQQQAIQSAVQQAHHRTGLHWQEIYRQLKQAFKVAKYDQLPQSQFGNAMAFIMSLQPITLPPAEERFTFDLTKEEISNLTLLLFSHGQMNWLLGKLVKPLEVIGSSYSPTVYGHHTEYKRYYDKSLPLARKLIEPLKQAHRADFEHLLYRLSAN
jgi:putative bacteriophage antirepressor|nr:MAG TPA: KilA-N domain [Caudoviricetes sp.]